MKDHKTILRYVFGGLVLIFGALTIYALKATETPRLVLFLGRFHPLLLHMPIGALVVTFFIDVLGRFQKNYAVQTVRNLLGFTAFFAIATCFLGYFLSLEGGYLEETLDLHFYTGIGTAAFVTGLFILSLQPSYTSNNLFFPLFVTTLVLISVAGHYGSVLTHGETFLTAYAVAPEKEKTIAVVDSLKLYQDVVSKILDNKCVQCHNGSKQKGEFSMISPALLLKGGVKGAPIIAGNAMGSSLYNRALLPISDKEHMPPEGKEQLTKDELWLIKHWINHGADFENYVTNVSVNDTLSRTLEKYLVFNTVVLPKASNDKVREVQEAGFSVLEIVPGEAALSVKYLAKEPTKKSIDALSELKEQLVELNFHTAAITDEMTSVLKKLDNLKSLKINSPQITDKTLKNITDLAHVEVLNLYNTGITNEGLTDFLTSVQPKTIYAWNTNVDKETARQLAIAYDITIENSITEGFVEESSLEVPDIIPARTLFSDTIHIRLSSRLKNVDIRYTLDGTEPTENAERYEEALVLRDSKTLKVKAFKEGWQPSELLEKEYAKVTQHIKSFTMKKEPDERYSESSKLFDLEEGSDTFSDGNWVGYFGDDLETMIDLGSVQEIDHITMRCLENTSSWIFFPTHVEVYTSETKEGVFVNVGEKMITRVGEGGDVATKKVTIALEGTKARYIKVRVKNYKTLPVWHPAAGNPSWLFVDEIYFW